MTLRDLVIRLYGQENVRDNGDSEVSVNCPFCLEIVGKKDFKARLGINTSTGVGHCYRCEFRGNKRYVFKELCRVFENSQFTLDRDTDEEVYVPKEVVKETPKQVFKLPSEYEPLWKHVNDRVGKKALQYLYSRNITPDQIKKHRIGFCAVGKYAYRIVFPITYKDQLVGIVARDFSGKAEYKYLNSKGDKTLFNVPRKTHHTKICNLAEGIFDAMSLERGVDPSEDCLATLGSGLTKPVLKILKRYKTIIVWPDPDRAGVEGAIKKAIKLKKMQKHVMIAMPDVADDENSDLGSMRSEEVEERRTTLVEQYSKAVAMRLRLRINSFVSPKKQKQRANHYQNNREFPH